MTGTAFTITIALLLHDTSGRPTACHLRFTLRMSRQCRWSGMCRAIKTLHNFSPPATEDEIRASSLQFVRKLSGFTKPSRANEAVFNRAVDDVAHVARHLLDALVSNAPPRDRAVEATKARERSAKRFDSAEVVMTGHNHN